MVAPITGPFLVSKSDSIAGRGSFYLVAHRYRQKKPYDLPLLYDYSRRYTVSATRVGVGAPTPSSRWNAGTTSNDIVAYWESNPKVQELIDAATNKAHAKFNDALSDNAQWLANAAEGRKSIEMMANRLIQIGRAFRALKRGYVYTFAKTLNIALKAGTKPRKIRVTSKWVSNTWLEYHFGWEPLVKDIYNSAAFLSAPFGLPVIKGRASIKKDIVFETTTGTSDRIHQRGLHSVEAHAHIQGQLRVTNSNLFLASRLGLINPVSVAWEIVPFSFVVDWFANVGQFIEQFSEFQGCQLLNPCYSYCVTDSCNGTFEEFYPYPTLYYRENGITFSRFGKRTLTIPSVTLGIKPAWRLSITRAATAIALLVQLGISK